MTVSMVYIKKMLGPTKPIWSIGDSFRDDSPMSVIKAQLFLAQLGLTNR